VDSRKRDPTSAGVDFPTEVQMQSAVQTFGMLGDPTRLRILWALLQGEQTVNRLAELVGMQQPTVSQHLAKLRMAGLVRQRRQGSYVFYEVDRKHVRPLLRQALGQADASAPKLAGVGKSTGPNRKRLGNGAATALSGWTMNHGYSMPAAPSVGLAIDTPAVVASIAIGILLLAPLSRIGDRLTSWLGRRTAVGPRQIAPHPSLGYQLRLLAAAVVVALAVTGIALGAIFLDVSRYDPTGPALAWSPGVAILSLGAAVTLSRLLQARAEEDRVLGSVGRLFVGPEH
jgi:DNA-binding transcriptional ArsR family regulator